MKSWATISISGLALLCCTGASDAAKFFHPIPHLTADVPTDAEPDIEIGSNNTKEDINKYQIKGYELVGYSAFNGKMSNIKAVTKYAKSIGSTLLVTESKFTGTRNLGEVGSTTFTKYGAFSFSSPVNQDRYDQAYMYFRKTPRIGLGTAMRVLSSDDHARIGTNKGLQVATVLPGSPAFQAEVLPNDILLSINDAPVFDMESYHAAAKSAFGSKAKLEILRNGQKVEKIVPLPSDGAW